MKLLRVLGISLALLLCGSLAHAQGVPAGTPHKVTLSWTAPSPVGGSGTLAGYNIYRTLSSGGVYTLVNTATIATTSFTDTTVTPGTSYSYCATTVDSLNSESACGIPVAVTIPTNPSAPTGLKITAQ